MISNVELSKSDQSILKIILEELEEQGVEKTPKNIRSHQLFSKIDQKEAFKEDNVSIIPINIEFGQKNPDKITIGISGTGIKLSNRIHQAFLTKTMQEVTNSLVHFSKVTEKLGLTNESEDKLSNIPDFFKELMKGWKKN